MGQSRQAVSRRAFVPYLVSRGSAVCLLHAVLLRTGRHVSEQKRTAGFDGSAVHPSAEPIHQLRWRSEAEDCFQGTAEAVRCAVGTRQRNNTGPGEHREGRESTKDHSLSAAGAWGCPGAPGLRQCRAEEPRGRCQGRCSATGLGAAAPSQTRAHLQPSERLGSGLWEPGVSAAWHCWDHTGKLRFVSAVIALNLLLFCNRALSCSAGFRLQRGG